MAITDRRATGGRPLAAVVRAALAGGLGLLQLREKDLEGGELFVLARELRSLTAAAGALLLVNDRVDVALAVEADGVVLPADSFPTDAARQLLGPARIIGRSTHSVAEVDRARREGCDLALFGPVWATPSKSGFGAPQGLDRLRDACRIDIPVFAVGGVDAANAAEARAAGAHGIAVIRAVMGAEDPARAAAELSSTAR